MDKERLSTRIRESKGEENNLVIFRDGFFRPRQQRGAIDDDSQIIDVHVGAGRVVLALQFDHVETGLKGNEAWASRELRNDTRNPAGSREIQAR
jgi:hypothetical protein